MTTDDPPQKPGTGRTRGIESAAHQRTKNAEKRANEAIRDLQKTGAAINFSSVARVGDVSKAFLHRHPDLAPRIRELNTAQTRALQENAATTARGESAVVAALHRRIREQEAAHAVQVKKLREEIRTLENQISSLYDQMGHRED